jgi:phenylalanyl-tRNA synthetase beta chain
VRADTASARLFVDVGNARADLALPCDLVEEIARLSGYDRIPETMPLEPIPEPLHEDTLASREALRDGLVRAGLQEIISYSMNGPELEGRLYAGQPGALRAAAVAVLNPVSVERSVLRTALVPGLLAAAALNLRNTPVCRLFEIGPVFAPGSTVMELPEESQAIGLLIGGIAVQPTLHDPKPRALDFFDLKAIVVDLLSSFGLASDLEFVPIETAPYRPGAAARILRAGQGYGTLGAVHPTVLQAFDLEGRAVFVAELPADLWISDVERRRAFREFDRLPSIELDIAMLVDRTVMASAVTKLVREFAGPLLRDAEVFDQFFDDKFGPNEKALAVRLRLNAGERTLEMTEALEVRSRVARALESALSARIRE